MLKNVIRVVFGLSLVVFAACEDKAEGEEAKPAEGAEAKPAEGAEAKPAEGAEAKPAEGAAPGAEINADNAADEAKKLEAEIADDKGAEEGDPE